MKITFHISSRPATRRRGFTLVEMLIAVALVVLMMSLFAEIFAVSTSMMTRQKGLAENDQRARLVAKFLDNDINSRTFRASMVPFQPGTTTAFLEDINLRKGYFAFSENDPNDDTDDVLYLTIDLTAPSQDKNRPPPVMPLYGKATAIGGAAGLSSNPNQPEGDNGEFISADSTGMSNTAEVVYFMRAGRLYRRQMLIRQPYLNLSAMTTASYDPMAPDNITRLINTDYPNFWRDFDYSAAYDGTAGRVRFQGADSLQNLNPSTGSPIDIGLPSTVPFSLGIPHLRFGHHWYLTDSGGTPNGAPREFVLSPGVSAFATSPFGGTGTTFIGTFTQEETSHSSFRYPGQTTTAMNNPYSRTDLIYDALTGSVTQYQADPNSRIGEDMVLPNVLSFDIKAWDPGVNDGPDGVPGYDSGAGSVLRDDNYDGIPNNNEERGFPFRTDVASNNVGQASDDGDWVNLGHGTSTGFFYGDQMVAWNLRNGNSTTYGNRFDSWHPSTLLTSPPYRPMYFVPNNTAAATLTPFRSRPFYSSAVSVGTIVFPDDGAGNLDTSLGLRWVYRRISDDPNGTATGSGTRPLQWPTEDYGIQNVNPNPAIDSTRWQAIPNWVPLRAIQIHIQYLDPSSGLIKDLTLVKSLMPADQYATP